jgi:hypothetical protein
MMQDEAKAVGSEFVAKTKHDEVSGGITPA